jgi:hypothetical protein
VPAMAAARLGRSNPSSSRRVGKGAALDSSRVGKIACAPCPRGDDGETRFCPPYSFYESGWIAGSSPAMTRWRHKYLIQIEYRLHNNYALDYYARLGVKIRILAHSGRVLEAYLNAERGVASCGGDSQPSPREAGAPPPGTTTRMRGVRCDRSGRNAGEGKRGPGAKNRHGASAGRRASPVWGREAPR